MNQSSPFPYFSFLLLSLCSLTTLGCNSSESFPADGAKVSGTVTYNGSPVEGASVTFRKNEGNDSAFAKTDASGNYSLSSTTIPGGTSAGSYLVTVKKYEESAAAEVSEDDPNYDGASETADAEPKSLLPKKYSSFSTSGLEFEVKVGENDIPIELAD